MQVPWRGELCQAGMSPHPLCCLSGLQRFYSRKRSLQDAAQKRRHEEELQAEEAGTQVGVDAPSSPCWTPRWGPPELCPRSPGLPGPSSGTDEEDCPECSAQSSSLQQLLPEDRVRLLFLLLENVGKLWASWEGAGSAVTSLLSGVCGMRP